MSAVDWLGVGEPHGRTPARVAAQDMAARVIMCAPFDSSRIASARRLLRAAMGELDRVDLRAMVDLGVYLMEHER